MNLRSLHCFLTAVEEMNFTKAAERLYISQQALSSHIQRLEEEYSVLLFERKPYLRLTVAGENMVFFARQILQAEAKMEAGFADITDNCKARLIFGLSQLRCQVFFQSIWDRYHPTHPNIDISLVDSTTDKFEELIQDGKLDLYIGVGSMLPSKPNFCHIPLVREHIYCLLTEKLLQEYFPHNWQEMLSSFADGIDLTKVSHLPFIMLSSKNSLRKNLDFFFSAHKIRPRVILETNYHELVFQLCNSGNGIGPVSPALLYHPTKYHFDKFPGLRAYPILNDIPDTVVYLAYRTDYQLPQYALEFAGIVQSVFQEYEKSIQLIIRETYTQ